MMTDEIGLAIPQILDVATQHGWRSRRRPRAAIEMRQQHRLIPAEPRDAAAACLFDRGDGPRRDGRGPRGPFRGQADGLRPETRDAHVERALRDLDTDGCHAAKLRPRRVASHTNNQPNKYKKTAHIGPYPEKGKETECEVSISAMILGKLRGVLPARSGVPILRSDRMDPLMPFQPVTPERVPAAVSRQIEKLILHGILRPGERLPAERDLADKLDVSRPSVREAVMILQDKGLLTTRAGAGIYVADVLGNAFSEALIRLFAEHDEAVFDYISFRRDLEGLAAQRTAQFASDTDLQIIQTLMDKMETAHLKTNPADEARIDAEFHMAIIEASHNVIMLHMMRSMFQLLREGVFYNRKVMFKRRTTRGTLLGHHRAINAALQARDPEAARQAVETHLSYVEQSLTDHQKAERNESIARQRYDHEQSR